MADDKNNQGFADRSRVNVNDDHDVRYWTGQFGCTAKQLRAAAIAVGVMVSDVEQELKRKR